MVKPRRAATISNAQAATYVRWPYTANLSFSDSCTRHPRARTPGNIGITKRYCESKAGRLLKMRPLIKRLIGLLERLDPRGDNAFPLQTTAQPRKHSTPPFSVFLGY